MRAAFALLLLACGASPIGRDATVAIDIDIEGGCAAAGIVRIDVRAYDLRPGYPIGGHLIAQAPCGESMRAWFELGEPRSLVFWGMSENEQPDHVGYIESEDVRDGARVTLGRARK